jgi:hypothetical protein
MRKLIKVKAVVVELISDVGSTENLVNSKPYELSHTYVKLAFNSLSRTLNCDWSNMLAMLIDFSEKNIFIIMVGWD